ncbi:MAG TPA: transposase [Gemmata sp.]|nr:transposase [Gemmata sp.]
MRSEILDHFLRAAPCAVLARTTLENLFDPRRLDDLFHRAAERQYHREVFFSDVLHLMLGVVLGTKPSVLAAYRAVRDELGVSHQAIYAKLAGTDDALTEALVADSADQVRPVVAELGAVRDEVVPGFRVRVVDGNLLGKTQRRLKPLRASWARGLPGRVLVVYEPASDLVTHAFLERDAHADERTRMDDVLGLVRAGELWLADGHFCTHEILGTIHAASAFFVVRQHGSMTGEEVGERREVGRTPTGVAYEQGLRMKGSNAGWVVRRLTLVLDHPTTDGLGEIHVLTNVPPSGADAVRLLDAYRDRWTIEKRFYDVAQTLNAEPDTLSYPAAALFAFGLGLVASNAVALMRAALRSVHGSAAEVVSDYYVAGEIRETYRGLTIALLVDPRSRPLAGTPRELAEQLRAIAAWVDPNRYRKSVRGPKRPPPKKSPYRNGATLSTQRLLEQQNENAGAP